MGRSELIPGYCTPGGSLRHCRRNNVLPPDCFSVSPELALSSIGLGTCLGNPDDATDSAVAGAATTLALAGCNVFDSAPNYRNGRAELCLGEALAALLHQGVDRDQLFVSTKVGIVPDSLLEGLSRGTLLPRTGIEVLPTGQCFSPAYLRWQVDQSRHRLGLKTIDCVYLHNIEEARCVRPDAFHSLLTRALETIEELVARGDLRSYGLATWHGLRVAGEDPRALGLGEIISLAAEVAGGRHGFRYLQLPVGLWASEGITNRNQPSNNGGSETPLMAAARLRLTVIASAPLRQGELAMADISFLGGLPRLSPAQRLLQFSRSVPGVATVLVGLKQKRHVAEALEVAALPRSDLAALTFSV